MSTHLFLPFSLPSDTYVRRVRVRVPVFDFREVVTVGTERRGSTRRTCGTGVAGARPRAAEASKVCRTRTGHWPPSSLCYRDSFVSFSPILLLHFDVLCATS